MAALTRLTLVNRFAYPDDSPTARLLQELAEAVKAARPEVEVRVLASNRLYHGSADALPLAETLQDIRFQRLAVPGPRPGLVWRALSYLAFYGKGLVALCAGLRRGEVVVCMTDPPMFFVLATFAAWCRGARIVHWVQDLYPDVVQSAGLLRRPLVMRLLLACRRWAYRHAVALVALGEGMRERLERDGTGTPVEIIPNWADGERIRPRDLRELPLREEWLPGKRFVVGYFGNLGFAHNFHSMLAAADRLRVQVDVQMLWVGDGSRRAEFQREIARLELPNVDWRPQQPFHRMPEILGVADVHLVMLDPQFDEVLLPSKTAVALAAGRPILFLGNPTSELARLVRDAQVGVAVAQEDVEGIVEAIRHLAADRAQCTVMGQRARQLFDERFERGQAVRRWLKLLARLETDGGAR